MFSAAYCDHISKGHICITKIFRKSEQKVNINCFFIFSEFIAKALNEINFFIYLGQSGPRGDSGAKGLQTRIL
jgi:hypothetical protein